MFQVYIDVNDALAIENDKKVIDDGQLKKTHSNCIFYDLFKVLFIKLFQCSRTKISFVILIFLWLNKIQKITIYFKL